MKYKTFMLLRNLGCLGVGGVAATSAFLGCRNMAKETPPVPSPTVEAPVSRFSPPPVKKKSTAKTKNGSSVPGTGTTQTVPTSAVATLSARDKDVIGLRKEPLSNGKSSGGGTKWVAIGNGFKAEFRADSGASKWQRVKIDLDNDKNWDERWDFKSDGSIKRRIAPSDDDSTYSVEYRLKSGETKWTRVK